MPQKLKKRRTQSYTATSSYRSFRRKAKTPLSSASNTSTRVADKSDSSSDYDDDYDGFGDARNGNLPSTSSSQVLDQPSTSTGITANGKGFLFRISHAANDSDDDQSIPDYDASQPSASDNMLRVLRSPPIHNNNHRTHPQNYSNVNQGAGTSSQRSNFFNLSLRQQQEVPPNGRKKQQPQEDDSSFVEDYASTNSNSLMSSTEESSNDSYPDYYGKKRKVENEADENGNESSSNNNSSSFNNNNSFNAVNNNYANGAGSSSNGQFGTPSNRVKLTPDSGNSSLPTPSPSSSSRSVSHNGGQHDVKKKIENIKRNYRKNIQTSDDDSD